MRRNIWVKGPRWGIALLCLALASLHLWWREYEQAIIDAGLGVACLMGKVPGQNDPAAVVATWTMIGVGLFVLALMALSAFVNR